MISAYECRVHAKEYLNRSIIRDEVLNLIKNEARRGHYYCQVSKSKIEDSDIKEDLETNGFKVEFSKKEAGYRYTNYIVSWEEEK